MGNIAYNQASLLLYFEFVNFRLTIFPFGLVPFKFDCISSYIVFSCFEFYLLRNFEFKPFAFYQLDLIVVVLTNFFSFPQNKA